MVREIVLSATYIQQSDAPPTAYQSDPENRLLARGSRYRMDAEMIRDQLLMVSGKLNTQLYGKSVKPPQPVYLLEASDAAAADVDPQRAVARVLRARRERTNTPLQALVLMNAPEYFKLARG